MADLLKVEWCGGPLDGCVEEGREFRILWHGPDPTAPTSKVVVYKLTSQPRLRYVFDQHLTSLANERISGGFTTE